MSRLDSVPTAEPTEPTRRIRPPSEDDTTRVDMTGEFPGENSTTEDESCIPEPVDEIRPTAEEQHPVPVPVKQEPTTMMRGLSLDERLWLYQHVLVKFRLYGHKPNLRGSVDVFPGYDKPFIKFITTDADDLQFWLQGRSILTPAFNGFRVIEGKENESILAYHDLLNRLILDANERHGNMATLTFLEGGEDAVRGKADAVAGGGYERIPSLRKPVGARKRNPDGKAR